MLANLECKRAPTARTEKSGAIATEFVCFFLCVVGATACSGRSLGKPERDAVVADGAFDGDAGSFCGDGVIEGDEQCDGVNIGEVTCPNTTGHLHGMVTCSDDCVLDTSGCHTCGDGVAQGPEACDGSDLGGESCLSLDYVMDGTLACFSECNYDLSGCCGDGTVGADEECDDGNTTDWDGCTNCLITEFRVDASAQESQLQPAVSSAPDGRFVVTWGAANGNDGHGRVFAPDGAPVGTTFQTGASSLVVPHNSVSWASNTMFVAAWIGAAPNGDRDDILQRRYNSDGTPLGPEYRVNTFTDGEQWMPAVSATPDGRFVTVWYSQTQNDSVFGQRFGTDGSPVGSEFRVGPPTETLLFFPSVSMGSSGNFVVVWNDQSGPAEGIYGQRFDDAGNSVGPSFEVSADGGHEPSISHTAGNSFVVVWEKGDGSGIAGRRFHADGTPVASAFQVSSSVPSDQRHSRVSAAPDGRFVVVWQSDGQDGSSWGVFARRFDTNGEAIGPEFQVNSYTIDYQHSPSVAVADNGCFVVVWESYGQGATGPRVFAHRYNANGEPRGVLPW